MQNLHAWEVDAPTYHFKVNKYVGDSSSIIMFRVHYVKIHGEIPFHDCTPQQYLPNNLSSDENRDHIKKLRIQVVYVPTYHISIDKSIGISSSRVILKLQHILRHGVFSFFYFSPWQHFSNVL